jgi:hypothetical protein
MTGDPWEVRNVPGGLTLELHGGDKPATMLRQGDQAIRVELAHVKGLVAALADGAADLAEVVSRGARGHHARVGGLPVDPAARGLGASGAGLFRGPDAPALTSPTPATAVRRRWR